MVINEQERASSLLEPPGQRCREVFGCRVGGRRWLGAIPLKIVLVGCSLGKSIPRPEFFVSVEPEGHVILLYTLNKYNVYLNGYWGE